MGERSANARHRAGLLPERPPLAEAGLRRPHRFPGEEVMIAGPDMNLGGADRAVEAAGMLVGVLLLRRRVVPAATGAGELFGRPDAVGHVAICGFPEGHRGNVAEPACMPVNPPAQNRL